MSIFGSMFRKALAIFLVFVLCWGNTGFCVNVHYCDTSKAFSVMVNHIIGERCSENDSHKDESDCTSGEAKSCCKKLEETLPSAKDDCCSNTEVELKISDAFQGAFNQIQIQKQLQSIPFIPLADCFCHFTSIPQAFQQNAVDPPDVPQEILISGQDLLIQNCVYRI